MIDFLAPNTKLVTERLNLNLVSKMIKDHHKVNHITLQFKNKTNLYESVWSELKHIPNPSATSIVWK